MNNERNIEKFRICFNLNTSFTSCIDGWIDSAMKKRVQVLVLEFLRDNLGDIYTFPYKLLGIGEGSALKHYAGFKSLKVLCLDHVDVNGEVLEYFMSHSTPALERLSVAYTKSLFNVRVVGPSVGLKYLETKCCFRLKRVEIRDTNLVSFIHIGGQMDLILNNVPTLVELSIDSFAGPSIDYMSCAFTQLSCCASQLETFMMGICGVDYNEDTAFPVFSKLKHLELTVLADYELGLSQLSSFMKACPYLERLVLKLCFKRRHYRRKLEKAAKCPHHNIKVLEVVGYRGHPNGVEHVMYLVENAVELEKIVIDPVQRWTFHHTGADIRRKDRKKAAKARRHALRWLKDRVPSTIEFVCS